jgi:cobalt/nickel transport system permease protein
MLFTMALVALSGVPSGHYLRRYAIALPFIIFPAVSALLLQETEHFAMFVLRISACVIPLLVLSSTTPFFELVKGLRRMGLPEIFTVMLTFLYRYAFLFQDELERMLRGRRARGFAGGRSMFDRRAMGAISATAGMVLVRAHKRGVRVYDALVARGYTGELRTLDRWRLDGKSAAFSLTFVLFGVFLLFVDRGWLFVFV